MHRYVFFRRRRNTSKYTRTPPMIHAQLYYAESVTIPLPRWIRYSKAAPDGTGEGAGGGIGLIRGRAPEQEDYQQGQEAEAGRSAAAFLSSWGNLSWIWAEPRGYGLLGIFYAVATHLMYVFKCIQAVVAEYVKSTCIQYVFIMYVNVLQIVRNIDNTSCIHDVVKLYSKCISCNTTVSSIF